MVESLSRDRWEAARLRHDERVGPIARDRLARTGRKHPVYDFLFEYYSYRAGHLLRWSPGIDVRLDGASPADMAWPQLFAFDERGAILPAHTFPRHRLEQLDWAIRYQTAIRDREPQFACFGLHECGEVGSWEFGVGSVSKSKQRNFFDQNKFKRSNIYFIQHTRTRTI